MDSQRDGQTERQEKKEGQIGGWSQVQKEGWKEKGDRQKERKRNDGQMRTDMDT